MDKKVVFLPCRFGASSPQAISVTRKLMLPFGLYLLLDVWCILVDKPISKFKSMQMDKKPCFYDAVLAPLVRTQSV